MNLRQLLDMLDSTNAMTAEIEVVDHLGGRHRVVALRTEADKKNVRIEIQPVTQSVTVTSLLPPQPTDTKAPVLDIGGEYWAPLSVNELADLVGRCLFLFGRGPCGNTILFFRVMGFVNATTRPEQAVLVVDGGDKAPSSFTAKELLLSDYRMEINNPHSRVGHRVEC